MPRGVYDRSKSKRKASTKSDSPPTGKKRGPKPKTIQTSGYLNVEGISTSPTTSFHAQLYHSQAVEAQIATLRANIQTLSSIRPGLGDVGVGAAVDQEILSTVKTMAQLREAMTSPQETPRQGARQGIPLPPTPLQLPNAPMMPLPPTPKPNNS